MEPDNKIMTHNKNITNNISSIESYPEFRHLTLLPMNISKVGRKLRD